MSFKDPSKSHIIKAIPFARIFVLYCFLFFFFSNESHLSQTDRYNFSSGFTDYKQEFSPLTNLCIKTGVVKTKGLQIKWPLQ